ncbi:MAG: LLM class oxidoreductase, partial [Solirubrobacteraceae bacterium]
APHPAPPLGLDPSARIVQSVVTACDMDEESTIDITKARFLTYVIGWKTFAKSYARNNGWDIRTIERIQANPVFHQRGVQNADESFLRHQLIDVAREIPDEWMQDSCAIGSAAQCLSQWRAFKDAGADQIMLYGSTPRQAEQVVRAWTAQRTAA